MLLSLVKKVCFVLALSLFTVFAHAQNIASINGKPISVQEFMWVYKKNHAGVSNASYTDLASYLNLYIDFKLKVADARAMKLDADTAYQHEINGYETALKNQKKIAPKTAAYGFIVNEYREGVLMFNVSEQKIWNKVQDDESALAKYFNANKTTYGDKDFNEIRGQVVADYQQSLETEWIKSLRAKYTIKINEAEIKKLAKL